jgi:hypothetical protein
MLLFDTFSHLKQCSYFFSTNLLLKYGVDVWNYARNFQIFYHFCACSVTGSLFLFTYDRHLLKPVQEKHKKMTVYKRLMNQKPTNKYFLYVSVQCVKCQDGGWFMKRSRQDGIRRQRCDQRPCRWWSRAERWHKRLGVTANSRGGLNT